MADILDSCVTLFPYVASWPALTFSWEMRLLMAVQNRVPTVLLFDSPRAKEHFNARSAAAAVIERLQLNGRVHQAVFHRTNSDVPLTDIAEISQALRYVWFNQPPTVAEIVAATEGDASLAAAPLRPTMVPPSAAALEIERTLMSEHGGDGDGSSNFVFLTGGAGYGKSAALHDWARNFLATNDKRRGVWYVENR